MRLKLLACKVLCRELSGLIKSCGNYIDVTYIRQGYHNQPSKLRAVLQGEIDRIDSGADRYTCELPGRDFDAILLGFGLCSGGTAGVYSRRYPIIMPRAHDCATLLLGSAKRYRQIFDECSGGVYWYSSGWLENSPMPGRENELEQYGRYREKYGEDNAAYLTGREKAKLKSYRRAAFIDTGACIPEYAAYAKSAADYYGWEYRVYKGDLTLLSDFLGGRWDEERFLRLEPRRSAEPSYDEKIVRAGKETEKN